MGKKKKKRLKRAAA